MGVCVGFRDPPEGLSNFTSCLEPLRAIDTIVVILTRNFFIWEIEKNFFHWICNIALLRSLYSGVGAVQPNVSAEKRREFEFLETFSHRRCHSLFLSPDSKNDRVVLRAVDLGQDSSNRVTLRRSNGLSRRVRNGRRPGVALVVRVLGEAIRAVAYN